MNLDEVVALLSRTPAALDALLRDLPDSWTSRDEGEGTWSAAGIVGHLIHGERTDWMGAHASSWTRATLARSRSSTASGT